MNAEPPDSFGRWGESRGRADRGKPLEGVSLRQPPSNLQAEQSLLGALLANNKSFERVADFLEPRHFADPVNGRIYQRISERILDGQLADAITIKSDLENAGILDDVGGTAYLAQLLTAMVGHAVVPEYGRAIHDAWTRRQLIEIGESVVNNAFGGDPTLNGALQIEQAERMLSELGGQSGRRSRVKSAGEWMRDANGITDSIYRLGVSPAVFTGMPAVDRATGGFWPSTFTLLAGIPGAGKTALAVQIAYAVANQIRRPAEEDWMAPEQIKRLPGVAVFSLEMSGEELGTRLNAWRAQVPLETLLTGKLDWASSAALVQAESDALSLPLRIYDCSTMSVALLGAKIRMHLKRQPERLIVVDHLLVLDAADQGKSKTGGADAATVAKAARDLKLLAKAFNLPLLVLTLATRASAARTNPRPTQGDVKWAGEGDADTLFFVHRPVMFMDEQPPKQGDRETEEKYAQRRMRHMNEWDSVQNLAELVVAKRRQGKTGVHRMQFNGKFTSFSEWGDTGV